MFRIVEGAMIVEGRKVDGVLVNDYEWFPLIPSEVKIYKNDGYRYIAIGGREVELHRAIHEIGRPKLLDKVYELAKLFA